MAGVQLGKGKLLSHSGQVCPMSISTAVTAIRTSGHCRPERGMDTSRTWGGSFCVVNITYTCTGNAVKSLVCYSYCVIVCHCYLVLSIHTCLYLQLLFLLLSAGVQTAVISNNYNTIFLHSCPAPTNM